MPRSICRHPCLSYPQANETAIQNQMRQEMLLIESQYSQLRRRHETMELDLKQAVAHNEQAGPINSEMRSLISTLQTQNKQLKAEVARYRRKCKEKNQDLEMVGFPFPSSLSYGITCRFMFDIDFRHVNGADSITY